MAGAVLSSYVSLPTDFSRLTLTTPTRSFSPSTARLTLSPPNYISLSSTFSSNGFNPGILSISGVPERSTLRRTIVCEAATKKKADSAVKRARQAEKRRLYNKSRKSEVRTRMKKVLVALDRLRKKSDAQPDEVLPIEKLIAEAYSAIDKAVKVGTLHRNTGEHRKSRLARRKKAVEIHHGWYTPAAAVVAS